MPDLRRLRLFRGTRERGELREYEVAAGEGMVVLDAVHMVQAEQAPDLAVRWNCKAGKCGSCSAEINGRPRLMCMTRAAVDLGRAGAALSGLAVPSYREIRRLLRLHHMNGVEDDHPFARRHLVLAQLTALSCPTKQAQAGHLPSLMIFSSSAGSGG